MYKYIFIINYIYIYNLIKFDIIYFKFRTYLKLEKKESLFIYLFNKKK